jgi:hypothetical protein
MTKLTQVMTILSLTLDACISGTQLLKESLKSSLFLNELNSVRKWFGCDRHCGLVVRVSGYRYRGPGFDPRRLQTFWEAAGLERCPLSLVRTTEELLGRKCSGSGLENRD